MTLRSYPAKGSDGVLSGTAFGAIEKGNSVVVRDDGRVERAPLSSIGGLPASDRRYRSCYATGIDMLFSCDKAGDGSFYIRADRFNPRAKNTPPVMAFNQQVTIAARSNYVLVSAGLAWSIRMGEVIMVAQWSSNVDEIVDVYTFQPNFALTWVTLDYTRAGVLGQGYVITQWSESAFDPDTDTIAWVGTNGPAKQYCTVSVRRVPFQDPIVEAGVNNYGGTALVSGEMNPAIVYCSGRDQWAHLWTGTGRSGTGMYVAFGDTPTSVAGADIKRFMSTHLTTTWTADYDPTTETIVAMDAMGSRGTSRRGYLLDARQGSVFLRGTVLDTSVKMNNVGVRRVCPGKFLICTDTGGSQLDSKMIILRVTTPGGVGYATEIHNVSGWLYGSSPSGGSVGIHPVGDEDFLIQGPTRGQWFNPAYPSALPQDYPLGFAKNDTPHNGSISVIGPGGILEGAEGTIQDGARYGLSEAGALVKWTSSSNYYYTGSGPGAVVGVGLSGNRLAVGYRVVEQVALLEDV